MTKWWLFVGLCSWFGHDTSLYLFDSFDYSYVGVLINLLVVGLVYFNYCFIRWLWCDSPDLLILSLFKMWGLFGIPIVIFSGYMGYVAYPLSYVFTFSIFTAFYSMTFDPLHWNRTIGDIRAGMRSFIMAVICAYFGTLIFNFIMYYFFMLISYLIRTM